MGHPIDGIMDSMLNHLKEMLTVETIMGKPVETKDGTIILPVSKVSFGFAIGGSEFNSSTLEETKKRGLEEEVKHQLPFGGGSAAKVNIVPVGFLVISENGTKMLPVNHLSAIDKLLDYVPDLLEKITDMTRKEKTVTYEFYENSSEEPMGDDKEET